MSSDSDDDELITPSMEAIESRPPAESTAKKQRGRPFKSGRSDNPKGRPTGSHNKATMAVEALLEGEAETIARGASMRAANPDDARAVREVLEAAGTKPTIRAVADALNASGQFTPVSPSTVHRWQQRAWRGVEKAGRPKSVANAPDLAAAALTGDPTSTRKDIVARADAEEVERLREMRGEELIALAGRESLVTLVLAQRQARDSLHTLEPKQVGDLQKALSGSLLALVEADRIARQATTAVVQAPAATSNSEVIEHDSLDPAWEAMRKAQFATAECEECRRRAQDPQDH